MIEEDEKILHPAGDKGGGTSIPRPHHHPCPHVLDPNAATLAVLETHDPISLARIQLEYAHGVAVTSVNAYEKLVNLLRKPG